MSFLSDLLSTRPTVGTRAQGEIPKPQRKVKAPPKQLGHTSADPDRAQAKRDEEAAWQVRRADAFVASGGKCLMLIPDICEPCLPGELEGHHFLPRSAGGNSQTTVCIPGCPNCHAAVEENRAWAYDAGFLQRRCDAGKPYSPIRPTPPLSWRPGAQLGHSKRRTAGKASAL